MLDTQRTTLDIVWSCVSTVVLTAWVAARPNVVARRRAWWEHLKLMIGIIITPELILVCAIRQICSAKLIMSNYRSQGWTMTHAYFLIMGGFEFVPPASESQQDPSPSEILSFERFSELIAKKKIDFPKITLGEINDRSKSDWLLLSIAILHTLWFVLQYAARVRHGLSVTELEFVTLVLICLHAIIYRLWWYKPFCVYEPVKIHPNVHEPVETHPKSSSLGAQNIGPVPRVFFSRLDEILEFFERGDAIRPVLARAGQHLKETGKDVDLLFRKLWNDGPIELLFVIVLFMIVFIVPFLVLSIVFLLILLPGISLYLLLIRVDNKPSIRNRGLVARVIAALQQTCYLITSSIDSILKDLVDANRLAFILVAFILLPVAFILIPIVTLFLFIFFLFVGLVVDADDCDDEVTVVETSRYILKTFRGIILATLHPFDNGLIVGLISVPMYFTGFVLLLALSPFALAISLVLYYTNTTIDPDSSGLICETHDAVISGAVKTQNTFKNILKAPDQSQFGVAYYLLFLPFIPLVILISLVDLSFDLLFLVTTLMSPIFPIGHVAFEVIAVIPTWIIDSITTDSFDRRATQVPIFYAPSSKDARYACVVAVALIGLGFFGLQCIGWSFQFPHHSTLQMSWRVTCLVLSAIPVIASPIILISTEESLKGSILYILQGLTAIVLLLIYFCARLSLIPQAIAMLVLKIQPPNVFITVPWTKYIPHIGL